MEPHLYTIYFNGHWFKPVTSRVQLCLFFIFHHHLCKSITCLRSQQSYSGIACRQMSLNYCDLRRQTTFYFYKVDHSICSRVSATCWRNPPSCRDTYSVHALPSERISYGTLRSCLQLCFSPTTQNCSTTRDDVRPSTTNWLRCHAQRLEPRYINKHHCTNSINCTFSLDYRFD